MVSTTFIEPDWEGHRRLVKEAQEKYEQSLKPSKIRNPMKHLKPKKKKRK